MFLMKVMEKKYCLQFKSNVENVATIKRFGGCYKHVVLMNLQHNFIVASNAAIHGVITHNV